MSITLVLLDEQQFYLFGQIQTSQKGGQPYGDTMVSVLWANHLGHSCLPRWSTLVEGDEQPYQPRL